MPSKNLTRGIMFKHLNSLAPVGVSVKSSTTKHGTVLTTEELQDIYKSAVLFHFNPPPDWPDDWLDKTINQVLNDIF